MRLLQADIRALAQNNTKLQYASATTLHYDAIGYLLPNYSPSIFLYTLNNVYFSNRDCLAKFRANAISSRIRINAYT